MSTLTPDGLNRIGEIVDRFESSWRNGDQPRLEDFLTELPDESVRDELLRALLRVELELRTAGGETPKPDDYLSRLPGFEPAIRDLVEAVQMPTAASPSRPHVLPFESRELPDYEVLETLGEGAMGVVLKARHRTLKRLVAIKVILPGRSAERFCREARLIAEIRSSYVVTVHDFRSLPDGRLVLIMEYVDGCDLRGAMRASGGTIAEDKAGNWMSTVCDGMVAASEQGLIHRDLKPANILIDAKGRALVADFGLARSETALSDMTVSDSVMGTPHYMAPEQAEDPRGVDTRADIYSFGATFYHVLTGTPPFDGPSVFSILLKHKSEPLISPCLRNPRISERVGSVIERCMAKSPGDRFSSFAEVRRELDARPGPFSPWDQTEDPELVKYLQQYQQRRPSYLDQPTKRGEHGDVYAFPRNRKIVILRGNIVEQEVEAIVSSDTQYLTMNYGVSLAIRQAAGPKVFEEARRYEMVRPGRVVVTSAGKLRCRFIFHGVTVGISTAGVIVPSRDLISEIMAGCCYHADSLEVQTMAFPLLGTGAMGFSREVCLDTMFLFLARSFLLGLSSLQEARIILFDPRRSVPDLK